MEDFFRVQEDKHKDKFGFEEEEEVNLDEFGIEADDVRFILLAERVEILSQKWRDNRSKPGMEAQKQSYDRFNFIRTITLILIIFQIILSRPRWCKIKGDKIDNECKFEGDINYYRSPLSLYDTGMDGLITTICLIFLASSKFYRMQVTIVTEEAKKTTYICAFLAVVYTCVSLAQLLSLTDVYINDIISMTFILVYNDSVRRASIRMYQIMIESIEILVIFCCALLLFACLSRVLFFDYDELYDTQENYAGFNFESFSQAFYTMIVAVSTTNYPMAMAKAYAQNRWTSWFFVINSFVMNFILLNLIMAVFFFYYQNFYVQNVKKLQKKPRLCLKLIEEMKKHELIPNTILKQLVEQYCENPNTNFAKADEMVDEVDQKIKELKKKAKMKNIEFDLYLRLETIRGHKFYNFLIGAIDIAIFILTLQNIEAFNQREESNDPKKQRIGRTSLFVQCILLSISMLSQGVGIVGKGFKATFKDWLITFDLVMTLISFLLGLILISQNDFDLLLRYPFTSIIFKFYCVVTVCKNLSVIKFLRNYRELRIVLDVLYRSAIFLMDLIGMMGIILLLFSSVGISLFGGVVNSSTVPHFEDITGEPFDDGLEYYNFNDYLNSILCLYSIILCGWQDFLRLVSFGNPKRSMVHNYYFVAFFLIANMFLLNVLTGFIIDNIVAYLSEDLEQGEEEKKENLMNIGVINTMLKFYKTTKEAASGKVNDVKNILLEDGGGIAVAEKKEKNQGIKVDNMKLFQ